MSHKQPSELARAQRSVLAGIMAACFVAAPARAELGDELFKLNASDAAAGDRFGHSVAISGNTAIVSAHWNDDAGEKSGSAYVYNVTTGQELLKLTASDAAGGDEFGNYIDVSGSTAIVGAWKNDDHGDNSGSAYLIDVATGAELFKLTASDAMAGAFFGHSVAIDGNTAIVAAWSETTIGSAYVFDVTTGLERFKLTASDSAIGTWFGESIELSGTRAIVGASEDDEAAHEAGAAYIFDLTTGQELFKLTASDAGSYDWFGTSVAISGNTAIVGAPGNKGGTAYYFDVITGQELAKHTGNDLGIRGGQFARAVAMSGNAAMVAAPFDDHAGRDSGSAYVYDVCTGQELVKLSASDAAAGDWFSYAFVGAPVALSGHAAIVGAYGNDDAGGESGAAYLFDLTRPISLDFNSDGNVDVADLNLLLAEGPVSEGISVTQCVNGHFDLTNDGVIDLTDRNQWLADAATLNGFTSAYKPGDANLSGEVDVSDFNLWNENKFTDTLRWDHGDLNGDGRVDVSDFNTWNENKFTSSDAANLVPEPTSCGIVVALLVGLASCGWRRRQER